MQMLLPREPPPFKGVSPLSHRPWTPWLTPPPSGSLLGRWVGGAECLRGTQHANIFELTLAPLSSAPPSLPTALPENLYYALLTLDSVKCHTHCRSNNNDKRTRMGLATQATMQRMSSGNAKTSEISF